MRFLNFINISYFFRGKSLFYGSSKQTLYSLRVTSYESNGSVLIGKLMNNTFLFYILTVCLRKQFIKIHYVSPNSYFVAKCMVHFWTYVVANVFLARVHSCTLVFYNDREPKHILSISFSDVPSQFLVNGLSHTLIVAAVKTRTSAMLFYVPSVLLSLHFMLIIIHNKSFRK